LLAREHLLERLRRAAVLGRTRLAVRHEGVREPRGPLGADVADRTHLGTGRGAPPERHPVAAVAEAADADPHALILVEGHVDHGLLTGGPGKTWTLPEGGGGGGGDETGRQRAREERASRGGREFGHSASFV